MNRIATFYRFAPFSDPAALRDGIAAVCRNAGTTGTIIVAGEGLNGTIAGPAGAIDAVLAHLRAVPGLEEMPVRLSSAEGEVFARMKVKLRREIVTFGARDADPAVRTGRHVPPAEWNATISRPDVVLVDTRNAFEVAAGTFPGAVDPGTRSFRAFPAWWAANRERFAGKTLALFCTGGIRCEKATSHILAEGPREVLQLKGGILAYLDAVPRGESLWQGECFVFDGRGSDAGAQLPS